MRWGLFKDRQILFIVLDNGQGMIMSAAFNIWEMKGRKIAGWLFEEDIKNIRLLLAEKHTSVVVACRNIMVSQDISAKIKKHLHSQYMRYNSKLAVRLEVETLERKYDPDAMLAKAAERKSCWTLPLKPSTPQQT